MQWHFSDEATFEAKGKGKQSSARQRGRDANPLLQQGGAVRSEEGYSASGTSTEGQSMRGCGPYENFQKL